MAYEILSNGFSPRSSSHSSSDIILNILCKFYLSRAEKERSQYFSEVNDLRAGLDHVSNEKVQKE